MALLQRVLILFVLVFAFVHFARSELLVGSRSHRGAGRLLGFAVGGRLLERSRLRLRRYHGSGGARAAWKSGSCATAPSSGGTPRRPHGCSPRSRFPTAWSSLTSSQYPRPLPEHFPISSYLPLAFTILWSAILGKVNPRVRCQLCWTPKASNDPVQEPRKAPPAGWHSPLQSTLANVCGGENR